MFLNLPKAGKFKSSEVGDVPSQLQFRAWFGNTETMTQWPQPDRAEMVLLAETYENQRYLPLKGFSDSMLPTDRAKWSDRDGDRKQMPDG